MRIFSMSTQFRPSIRVLQIGLFGLLVSMVALLPWVRNRAYLRDFYDYGMFSAVNARVAAGERPYVDFVTPVQSAMFLLDYASERTGGGTYLAMTNGAALFIVAGVFCLGLMLVRCWPPLLAMGVAGAIVIGSASQHTIIVYNPLGVFGMALAVWSFAVAPVLRRETAGWHLLAALGLFLGGFNKLNFHLVSCAMSAGWVLYALAGRRATWGQTAQALLFIALFGGVLPILAQVGWTGSSLRQLYYNIVELPFLTRAGRLSALESSHIYLGTINDFYGTIQLPLTGLFGIVIAGLAAVAAWYDRTSLAIGWLRLFIILAAVASSLAGVALLATNNEIAYVPLSASLVLAAGIWLGFRIPVRGAWGLIGLVVPAILLAGYGWESAWRGQRSQFGHSIEPRGEYMDGGSIGDDFRYLRGTMLPPNIVQSLADVAEWRKALPEEQRSRIYYGSGAEWLVHVWPVRQIRGMALLQNAFVNGIEADDLFQKEVLAGGTYRYILLPVTWDNWSLPIQQQLARGFIRHHVGPTYIVYEKLPDGIPDARPLEFLLRFGGNVDSQRLLSKMQLGELSNGRTYLGTSEGQGELRLMEPSHRASGEAVLQRRNTAPKDRAASVHFEVFAVSGETRHSRWAADVVLPPGQEEVMVPTERLDSGGLPLVYSVKVPPGSAEMVTAGWRALALWDSIDGPDQPPVLLQGGWPLRPAGAGFAAALLPIEMKGSPVYFRNSWEQDGRCQLPPGGEIWIKLSGLYANVAITVSGAGIATGQAASGLRVIYYKGGRMETFHPLSDGKEGMLHFGVWSSENDGWLGILADPHPTVPTLSVRIDSARR